MEKKSIVIVANMGELKAFRVVEKEGINRQAEVGSKEGDRMKHSMLEEIRDMDYLEAHLRKHEKVSDKDGNFKGASGESHNTELENSKRHIKEIADDIAAIFQQEEAAEWYLAFPKENCAKLKESLSGPLAASLVKCMETDLVKADKNKILSHL